MNWLSKIKQNEKGSATIEFLGIVPIAFILLVIIWQFIVGVNAVIVTNAAVNEYAKVYSITEDENEAELALHKILDSTGGYLTFKEFVRKPNDDGDGIPDKEFKTEVAVNIGLVFLPKKILGSEVPKIEFIASASGRVIE